MILVLSIAYAMIGALLLVILVYARLPWPAKAVFVAVTSAFYIASFLGTRGLLGWASIDRLPATFKLLQARIVEPHTLTGDPGAIYLWVEALDDGNRPSGVPRAYRLPFTASLAEKTDKARAALAEGRPQAGRAFDTSPSDGSLLLSAARAFIIPNGVTPDTTGDEPPASKGAPPPHDDVSFVPLLPPRMPPKDGQAE
jgi:hypothetical protein